MVGEAQTCNSFSQECSLFGGFARHHLSRRSGEVVKVELRAQSRTQHQGARERASEHEWGLKLIDLFSFDTNFLISVNPFAK